MAFADIFVPSSTPCRLISTAGSLIKIAALGCLDDPPQYTLTLSVAIALNATSISVTPTASVPTSALAEISVTNPLRLEAGRAIYFGTTPVIVAATTLITQTATPTVVPIRPAPAAVLITVTASVISSLTLLSATSLSEQGNTTAVESTDLTSGVQFATQQVGREATIPLEWNARVDDLADWTILHRAEKALQDVYVHLYTPGGLNTFGRAQVVSINRNKAIKEVVRCTATLNMQPPYAEPTLYQYESASRQATIDLVARLMGFARYTT